MMSGNCDVEMTDEPIRLSQKSFLSPSSSSRASDNDHKPPSSRTSSFFGHSHSPPILPPIALPVLPIDSPEQKYRPATEETPANLEVSNGTASTSNGTASTSAPASSAQPTATATGSKPVSTAAPRKAKRRSPSPTPPPPVVPLSTIRMNITLGGPDNYEVDIASLAKASGQRPATPVQSKRHSNDTSDGSDDEEEPTLLSKAKNKRKKAHTGAEYYDVNDPFIDDSELALDERTYFGQTKQHGFYVSSGEVALKIDQAKKTKTKRLFANIDLPSSTPAAGPSHHQPEGRGTREEPIPLLSDNEDDGAHLRQQQEHAGQKRKRYTTVIENGKKRKIVDIRSFHPDLQAAFESLQAAIAAESWTEKGKFPASIKPILASVALLAVKLNEYDDHFFSLMPQLFPYNKFTMTKLIKRTIFAEHTKMILDRQDELLKQLGDLAREGLPKAEEDYARNLAAWHARQEKSKPNSASAADTGVTTADDAPMQIDPTELEANDNDAVDADGVTAAEKKNIANNPPQKKFRLNETMKSLVWQLVLLSNQCGAMENEKNGLEQSTLLVSEQALRKVLYQKIISVFPTGWMTSNHISRDVSAIKKRLEREAKEDGM